MVTAKWDDTRENGSGEFGMYPASLKERVLSEVVIASCDRTIKVGLDSHKYCAGGLILASVVRCKKPFIDVI